jgi:hypothetical protein
LQSDCVATEDDDSDERESRKEASSSFGHEDEVGEQIEILMLMEWTKGLLQRKQTRLLLTEEEEVHILHYPDYCCYVLYDKLEAFAVDDQESEEEDGNAYEIAVDHDQSNPSEFEDDDRELTSVLQMQVSSLWLRQRRKSHFRDEEEVFHD